ncbi:hypothetical protein OQA88_5393 [Cercophora sp. LCS_1]
MHHSYKRIDPTDGETGGPVEDEIKPPLKTRKTRRDVLLVVKDMTLTTLAILGLLAIIYSTQQSQRGIGTLRKSCNCGNSVAEARARGCKYDSLGTAWLPDHCRDDELTAEFERSGDGPDGRWLYFADPRLTKPLKLEEVADLGDVPNATFHVGVGWHTAHCFFSWRFEHRARQNGKVVQGRVDNEMHIHHCRDVILHHAGQGVEAGVSLNADVS